jgi:dTDP-glucose 4,6-dehydratase
MRILVTGGAGFIGSNFIRYILKTYPEYFVVNYDKLTYAGHLESLTDVELNSNYKFVKGDICDRARVDEVIKANKIDTIVHFAAESHVDRSIAFPEEFVRTNVLGTQVLLDAALKNGITRFHHVSTDEVFGELPLNSKSKFSETTTYNPKSPYSASKASSDHLVRSYFETYKLPVTITNCSNNYGAFQDPEKFIPRSITNLLTGKKIQVYGDGKYVRDWLHVEDHCRAIDMVMHKGKPGETYLVGGTKKDVNNLAISEMLLKLTGRDKSFIEFVTDRPGHDRRYAVDFSKIEKELGWNPMGDFESRLAETVEWYRNNEWWWKPLKVKAEKFYRRNQIAKEAEKFMQYFKPTSIPGLTVIEMPTYDDNRGFFREAARLNALKKVTGVNLKVKQWNHSESKPGVIRGLHAEGWNKVVYPISGEMTSILVDIRPDSPTFGKHETIKFSENSLKALFIPKGVANSICVTGKKNVHYLYLVDAYYNGSDTTAVALDDPDLKIDWPIAKPIISARDKANPRLRDLFPAKFIGR